MIHLVHTFAHYLAILTSAPINWSFAGVLIPTLCYLVTAADFYVRGDHAMALVFGGYSVANCGFLIAALR